MLKFGWVSIDSSEESSMTNFRSALKVSSVSLACESVTGFSVFFCEVTVVDVVVDNCSSLSLGVVLCPFVLVC